MTTIQQLKALGEEIGLSGLDLATFIKEQQTAEREERDQERAHQKKLADAQKELADAQKEEREQRAIEAEKEREQRAKEAEKEREQRATEAEKEREQRAKEAEKERAFELEKLKVQELKETRNRELEVERLAVQAKKDKMDYEIRKLAAEKGQDADISTESKPNVFGKAPRMPHFDEQHDFMDSYLSRFERFADSQKWKRDHWAMYLSALLKGRALDVYARLPPDQAKDYDQLKEALLKRYRLSAEGFKTRFRSSKPDAGETPLQYLTRLDNYLQRWIELAKVDQTYDGLKALIVQEQYLSVCPKELALFVKERTPTTITELGSLAEKYLEAHASKPISGIDPKSMRTWESQSETRKCHLCDSPNHLQKSCPKRNQDSKTSTPTMSQQRQFQTSSSRPVPTCYTCGKRGHIARNCFSSTRAAAANLLPSAERYPENIDQYQEAAVMQPVSRPVSLMALQRPPPPLQTFQQTPQTFQQTPTRVTCKQHTLADCRECFNLPPQPHTCNALVAICEECGQRHPIIADACHANGTCKQMPTSQGTVEQHPVTVLRDTGCSTIVVRRSLVPEENLTGQEQICVLIDGTIRRTPVAEIDIETPYLTGRVTAVCMRNPLYDLIIGNVNGVSDPSSAELHAVVTRSQSRQVNKTHLLSVPSEIESEVDPEVLKTLQQNDQTLEKAREIADEDKNNSVPRFQVQRGFLYRIRRTIHGEPVKQLALPTLLRHRVMKLAHAGLMSGHQGINRTQERVAANFWWPGISGDITRYCHSCDVCQRTVAKGRIPKVPLVKVPIIDTPFKRIGMDLVGPIAPPTSKGHRYILTIVDYATRYPEAVALRNIETTTVAEAMVSIFSRVGIPTEILTDQGSQFTGNLMKEVSRLLSVKQLTTTPYHPQCNGLVERFNGTLKLMLKRMCAERPKDWDRYIDPLLFAYREMPQESLGFSPFEMLYGRSVRGPMRILRELWTHEQADTDVKTTYEYVANLRERLQQTWDLAHDQLRQSQIRQKKQYDYKSKERNFKPGDKVLILLPSSENKLLMQWKGPFEVLERIEPADYRIQLPNKNRIFHANLLKKYYTAVDDVTDNSQITNITGAAILEPDDAGYSFEIEIDTLNSHQKETVSDVKINPELTVEQHEDVKQLLFEYQDIFSDVPSITNLGEHEINVTTAEPIRGKAYPLPHSMRDTLDKEIDSMLAMGIIEPSSAAYASPVVMVKKPDGSARVCVDYRRLNKITIFDPEPMPSAEEIFAKLSSDRYFSKFDLSKGYWQVPMREQDRDFTTFVCHRGLFRFTVMPFGLVNAPATFSRLMRRLLANTQKLDNYLDDVLSHTQTWSQHLNTLREFFSRIRQAQLTLRPSKCEIGETSVSFLGHQLVEGCLKPRLEMVDKIRDAETPRTKKQLRSFLGLVGFYRRFIPNFATIAVPLTDATKKQNPNEITWDETKRRAFQALKVYVTNPPVLHLPDVHRPFILQTDASNIGLGAILLQEDDSGMKHPVAFASRKLLPRETKYSTIERECLAIVWGVTKFQEYLYGIQFVLETDHQPLQYLAKAQFQNGRLMRWALALQPYRFLLRAIHGRDNVGADCLSRNPLEDTSQ